MSLDFHQRKETSSRQILEFMQRNGAVTIKDLESLLGVTTTAVRQHLVALQGEGYVAWQAVNDGVGRPRHVYKLTEKAREFFACNCDDLALTLLEEVFAVEGRERALMLLDRVGNRLARRYAPGVRSSVLQERVSQLAETLERRGVLTDVTVLDDDAIMLKTYNCPFHELAQEHREICEMDEKMMGAILGSEVSLSACLFDGHAGCSFVVRNNGKS
jgi:predicted ArsR family transcriptional regulator